MDKVEKISKIESIFLIVTIMINQIIFNVPNIILHTTGSSGWINVIYISIITIIFGYIICKIFKKFPAFDIVDISNYLGGNIFKTIVGLIFIFLFFIYNVYCIYYFANALKLIYFNETPLIVLLILFIFPPILINKYGLKSIASVNLIFIPFALISIILLFFGSASDFVIQNIFPVFGFGVKETFLYGLTNLFSFSGLAYLFFLNPFIKEIGDFKKITIISLVISSIYLFLSVFCLLLLFSFITMNDQLFSLYLSTRLLAFGTFLQRLDAIFILIWILNNFCFCSFGFFYIINIIKKLIKIKNQKQLLYPISALTFSACLLFNNIADLKRYSEYFYKYFTLPVIFVVSFLILIFANFKFNRSNKKKQI